MNFSRYNEDEPCEASERDRLDRQFWLIILETWTMWEIEAWEQFATKHEQAINW